MVELRTAYALLVKFEKKRNRTDRVGGSGSVVYARLRAVYMRVSWPNP